MAFFQAGSGGEAVEQLGTCVCSSRTLRLVRPKWGSEAPSPAKTHSRPVETLPVVPSAPSLSKGTK